MNQVLCDLTPTQCQVYLDIVAAVTAGDGPPMVAEVSRVRLEVDVKVGDEVFYVHNDYNYTIAILANKIAKLVPGSDEELPPGVGTFYQLYVF